MIGIFDSGVGGLTVVKEALKQLAGYQLVYFGDTARTPYGNKSAELVTQYAIQDVQFLLDKGAKIIIAGCNTASAVALDALKAKFPHVPLFNVIAPAVARAKTVTHIKRIGVIGTTATVNSGIYQRLLKETGNGFTVMPKPCPLLVPLVEENWIDRPETKMILRRYLSGFKANNIDALILGCTHYPLLHKLIAKKMGKRVHIIDPAEETVAQVKKYLAGHPDVDASLSRSTNHTFYFSDVTDKVREITTRWLKQPVHIERALVE